MKEIITVSCVNFASVWGDKSSNLQRIEEIIAVEARKGADLIVFPELALTGYDDSLKLTDAPAEDRMPRKLAETVPGPSTLRILETTRKYGVYTVLGMPERDTEDPTKCYNAAAIIGPESIIGSHRKTHLPFSERKWASPGEYPKMFQTPWGPIGIGICYETYVFPELIRYYRAMGCRLYLNVTAVGILPGQTVTPENSRISIEYHCANNSIFIATANMFGKEIEQDYFGGSSIVGPGAKSTMIHYYAGLPFTDPRADNGDIVSATIDLSYASRSFLAKQWASEDGSPDYRPELYRSMNAEVLRHRSSS